MENPLVPGPLDLLVAGLTIAVWVLAALALISAIRARHVTGLRFLLWFVAIVFLPVLGPTLWFLRGREPAFARSGD